MWIQVNIRGPNEEITFREKASYVYHFFDHPYILRTCIKLISLFFIHTFQWFIKEINYGKNFILFG
jgi:uncharacterized protein YdaL